VARILYSQRASSFSSSINSSKTIPSVANLARSDTLAEQPGPDRKPVRPAPTAGWKQLSPSNPLKADRYFAAPVSSRESLKRRRLFRQLSQAQQPSTSAGPRRHWEAGRQVSRAVAPARRLKSHKKGPKEQTGAFLSPLVHLCAFVVVVFAPFPIVTVFRLISLVPLPVIPMGFVLPLDVIGVLTRPPGVYLPVLRATSAQKWNHQQRGSQKAAKSVHAHSFPSVGTVGPSQRCGQIPTGCSVSAEMAAHVTHEILQPGRPSAGSQKHPFHRRLSTES